LSENRRLMEEATKNYLEDLYSCIPWTKFLGLWEAEDEHLVGSYILRGPEGFGKIATPPSVRISDDMPQEQALSLLEKCLEMSDIDNECYLFLSMGPWAHLKILDRSRWLHGLWRMRIPRLNLDASAALLLSAEKNKAIYFRIADHHIIEVYLADVS